MPQQQEQQQQTKSNSSRSTAEDNEEKERMKRHTISLPMMTSNEFHLFIFLFVLTIMEFQTNLLTTMKMTMTTSTTTITTIDDYYSIVGQSGCLGCLITAAFLVMMTMNTMKTSTWYSYRPFFPIRFVIHVVGPLGFVESCLRFLSYTPSLVLNSRNHQNGSSITTSMLLPYSFQWLVEFFLHFEMPLGPTWPRYVGLGYWIVVLALLVKPTMIIARQDTSVVITRKWFHLVAVILFVPTTHYFPKLMALAYAVAFCVLLVLECLRKDVPLLNEFYCLLQDPTKDVAEGMILSHICLILGCAIPLWFGLAMEERIGCQMLLWHWGTLCLGVGDAMAAVIGKTYGRIRWGKNRRTVEGSMAMWMSMITAGSFLVTRDQWSLLLEATTLATILEAYTTDMDNLILPLAGSIWIVLRLLVDEK